MENNPAGNQTQRPRDRDIPSSSLLLFASRHWYSAVKVVALYIILNICIMSFGLDLWANWLISGISLVAYIFFSYMDIWRLALRDQNLVKYKYIEYNKWKGLISGLLAQIPGLIVIIIFAIMNSAGSAYSDFFKMLYFIIYSPFVQLVSAIDPNSILPYLIPLPVIPVVSALAYYCGYRNIGILARVIYKRQTDRSKNKKLR